MSSFFILAGQSGDRLIRFIFFDLLAVITEGDLSSENIDSQERQNVRPIP
jgi:hypothetical protein